MTARCLLLLAVALGLTSCADAFEAGEPGAGGDALVVHVAPGGDDGAAGGRDAPLRTIGAAVQRLEATGGTVEVAPGEFGMLGGAQGGERLITVVGPGEPGRPTVRARPAVSIAGANLFGTRNLRFVRVSMTGPVTIQPDPGDKSRRPANLSFKNVEFAPTDPSATCLTFRGGVKRLVVRASWMHDCARAVWGVDGNQGETRSRDVVVQDSVLQRFSIDAIFFGAVDRLTIDRNRITDVKDPTGAVHNDSIQFIGNSKRVRITRNVIARSKDQIILIQPVTGPVSDVLIRDNLIYDSGAFAVQAQGAPRLRLINNTIWRSAFDALLLRQPVGLEGLMDDAVVENNILSGMQFFEGATAKSFKGNIVGKPLTFRAPGNRTLRTPGFRDERGNDFRLTADSPARRAGVARERGAADLIGRRRGERPSAGAYE